MHSTIKELGKYFMAQLEEGICLQSTFWWQGETYGISRNQSEKQRIQNTGKFCYPNPIHSYKCAAQIPRHFLNGGEKVPQPSPSNTPKH